MRGRFVKRNGPTLHHRKCRNPLERFNARKAALGVQDRSTGSYCEFFTPDTCGGNGKYKIEHWSFGRITMIELYEAA